MFQFQNFYKYFIKLLKCLLNLFILFSTKKKKFTLCIKFFIIIFFSKVFLVLISEK